MSDDGEPAGTAGKPILEVIRGKELTDVLVVITRYFGGTLLGTGGLVRAYTAAALEGIGDSKIITRIYGVKLHMTIEYGDWGKIQYSPKTLRCSASGLMASAICQNSQDLLSQASL